MRYYEFRKPLIEDVSQGTLNALNNILDFVKSRIELEDAEPKVSSSVIITMMQNSGHQGFTFKDFIKIYNNSPELQKEISKPEQNGKIEFLPDPDLEPGTNLAGMGANMMQGVMPDQMAAQMPGQLPNVPGTDAMGMQQPMAGGMDQNEPPLSAEPSGNIEGPEGTEQTVKSMAKKALKRRQ